MISHVGARCVIGVNEARGRMTEDSSLYLRKRAQQERDLAKVRQSEQRIADAHRAVAEEYERHADGIDGVTKTPVDADSE